ncbi:MAG: hypothetical protein LBE36_11245 [Flavobacteriaceae bacterium]|jgi:hypothetical protein|nr:hypothetical protein [Flavobacteriaceae bacterium]
MKNWNFMRLLRLLLGIAIIVQGVVSREWIFTFIGVLFSLMPLLNIGCCGVSGCDLPVSKNRKKTENTTYDIH